MDPRHYRALIGLLLLAAWLYSPLVAAPFVYEDAQTVSATPVWRVPGRGLTVWTLTGATASSAHLGNIAVHLLNGALVALVAAPLVGSVAAVCAAGVFLLHPLTSEAVAYATGRADLLVTSFTLIAIWAARAWVDRGGRWRVAAGLLAVIGAALSKEIGLVALPLVVLTLAIWRPACRPSAAAVAGLCGLGGLALGATWARVLSWTVQLNGSPAMDWPTFAWLQLGAAWDLLVRAVWLAGYSIDHDPVAFTETWRLLAALLTLSAGGLIVACWRRAPAVAWGLAWIGICLAPRFVFADLEFLTEYKLATAMVGVSVVLGQGLALLVPTTAPMWRERTA